MQERSIWVSIISIALYCNELSNKTMAVAPCIRRYASFSATSSKIVVWCRGFSSYNRKGFGSSNIQVVDDNIFWAPSSYNSSQADQTPPTSTTVTEDRTLPAHYDFVDNMEDMRFRGELFFELDRNCFDYDEHFSPRRYILDKLRKEVAEEEEEKWIDKEDDHNLLSDFTKNKRFLINGQSDSSSKEHAYSISEVGESESTKSDVLEEQDSSERSKDLSEESNQSWIHEKENAITTLKMCNDPSMIAKYALFEVERSLSCNNRSRLRRTDRYFNPYYLVIFISRKSVTIEVKHRPSFHVVVVAQTISKDLRYVLERRNDLFACEVTATTLAHRAIAEDIYTAVFNLKSREQLEERHLAILETLVDHGIDIKVRLKGEFKSDEEPTYDSYFLQVSDMRKMFELGC